MKLSFPAIFILCYLLLFLPGSSLAVESAPKITDREIIESLSEIKAQQRVHDQRFDYINTRFDNINNRFDDSNNRFTDINARISGLQYTMLALFGAIISLIIALFGYMIWDRRTMMQPM